MGFELGTSGLKRQVPYETDYKKELNAAPALRLLEEENLQAIDKNT